MKKIIGLIAVICIIATTVVSCGCGNNSTVNSENSSSSMFITIEGADDWRIVYHAKTKVMYAVSGNAWGSNGGEGVFTLLVNADGSPMLYEE